MSIRPEDWIESVFSTPSAIRLLRILARDPTRGWTEREIAGEAKIPPSTAHLTLRRLLDTGFLSVRNVGRSHLVTLRTDSELAKWVVELFQREAQTLERAVAAASAAFAPAVALYLYGSTNRREAGPNSDVDLLAIGPDPKTAQESAEDAENAFQRVIPARVQVLALDRGAARKARYRTLLANVKNEGRPLSKTMLKDGL